MKVAIAIIDGTGEWDDGDYAVAMADSFCSQLRYIFFHAANYERGPSAEGYRMAERGDRAADYLIKKRKEGAEVLLLAGYSRGGSAALMAAARLNAFKVNVDGLFLFDPVARHLTPGGEIIPANVSASWTAIRSSDPMMVRRYDDTIATTILGVEVPGIRGNPMRPSFGNTGLNVPSTGSHLLRVFAGSHGALGGVGWKHVKEDPGCQIEVAAYMNAGLAKFGVPRKLESRPIR